MRDRIPYTHTHKMCKCPDSYAGGTENRNHLLYHLDCGKLLRWQGMYCTVCKQYYIKDFRTSNSGCARHHKCWDCLQSTEECCELAVRHGLPPYYEPIGVNPRKYTDEELSTVLTRLPF